MNDDKIRISPDALITMIVTEAQNRELAQMPSLEEMNEAFHPSEKFLDKMDSLVRETKSKAKHKQHILSIKRFFITFATVLSIFSCTMLPVKAVREVVVTTLLEWHDKFVSVMFIDDAGTSATDTFQVTTTYIPSGLTQIESSPNDSNTYYALYEDEQKHTFSIRILPIENVQVTSLDSEFSSYYSLNFDDTQAIWGIMDDGLNALLWEQNGLSFKISGYFDLSEIVKVAKGIEIK